MLSYEELKPVVEMMARKYHSKAHMDYQDMCQDLWMFMYETKIENIRLATVMMKNKCIDISRKSWSLDNKRDYNDPDSVFATTSNKSDFTEGIEIEDILDSLDEREYKFAVASAYLTGGVVSLEKRFLEIFNNLSDENKDIIKNWNKRFSDDVIFKSIVGIKTGSNSGTARAIKWGIYSKIRDHGIIIDKYEKAYN